MSMHHERDPEAINEATRPEVGYEVRDISVKGLGLSVFWFFAGSTICIALTYLGFWAMIDLPLRPEEKPAVIPQYPNPTLQGNVTVKQDIHSLRREEDQRMNSYGWVDKEKGTAHMPIERAMEEVAAQGLPKTLAQTSGGTQ